MQGMQGMQRLQGQQGQQGLQSGEGREGRRRFSTSRKRRIASSCRAVRPFVAWSFSRLPQRVYSERSCDEYDAPRDGVPVFVHVSRGNRREA